MREKMRNSGIDIIGEISWGIHFCQFYQTKEDLIDVLVPYFKVGLKNNEFCLWVISELLDENEAKEALRVAIPDIDTYIENGQVEIVPYPYWHVEEGILDSQAVLNHLIEKTNKALSSGYDGLRYSGNNFSSYEKLLGSIIGKYPMMTLCTYPIDKYNALEVLEIVTNHQFALTKKEGKWERIESSCQKNNKECKQIEKTLQESENWYKTMFDNSLDGVFLTTPDGTILAANPAACHMFEMTEKEITRAGINGTVDMSDPRLKYVLEERARTGRFKGELNHRRKDGTIFPSEISSTLFKDKNGLTKAVMIIRDITKRKRIEDALRGSEKRFRALVMASSEMVYRVSPHWNEMRYFYGRGFLANTESPNPTWLNEYVLPEDQPRVTVIINEAIRKKSTYQTEHRVRLADGSVGWIFSRAVPLLDANDEIVEWFGAASDITKRKEVEERLRESEEKYRNIVETSNEGIYLVDDEGKITYANKIMETSGYTLEEIIGRPIWDFINEESMPVAKRNFEKRWQGIDDSYELKLMRKDGSFIWGLISAKSLFNTEGKFIGYLGMLTDITQRKQAEEILANIETARKKEIHHRIKNNLQVISSLLDLQAEQFKNKECIRNSDVLEAFRESQDRVISMALIHEELYRCEELDKLNFSPYIEELVENLFQTYRLGNTDISLNMDLEENLFFDMDTAVPLGIIVNELVSNALKHAFPDRKKGEIRIKFHREGLTELESKDCQSTGTSFILSISDNGVGIPENLDVKDLNSLGMQLVTSLVDQLDGELELKSNNGTEFTIRFTVIKRRIGLQSA